MYLLVNGGRQLGIVFQAIDELMSPFGAALVAPGHLRPLRLDVHGGLGLGCDYLAQGSDKMCGARDAFAEICDLRAGGTVPLLVAET